MKTEVLKTILESESDYFIVESHDPWYRGSVEGISLVLISLPDKLRKIKREKTIDTITVKEMEMFMETNIDTNIYIFPKYPPFQQYQRVLLHAVDCVPLEGEIDLAELLSAELRTALSVRTFLANTKEKERTQEELADICNNTSKLKESIFKDNTFDINNILSLREYFQKLRHDKNHHLGLGDIRLTIGQQEEICNLVERLENTKK